MSFVTFLKQLSYFRKKKIRDLYTCRCEVYSIPMLRATGCEELMYIMYYVDSWALTTKTTATISFVSVVQYYLYICEYIKLCLLWFLL